MSSLSIVKEITSIDFKSCIAFICRNTVCTHTSAWSRTFARVVNNLKSALLTMFAKSSMVYALTLYFAISKNDQTHFKNLAANAARF